MIHCIILTTRKDDFLKFYQGLTEDSNCTIHWEESGKQAFDYLANNSVDLVIVDEVIADMDGITFAEQLIKKNPMMQCAVVSPLTPKEFHEASEGLGIMMQLPVNPDKEIGLKLVRQLNKIVELINKSKMR